MRKVVSDQFQSSSHNVKLTVSIVIMEHEPSFFWFCFEMNVRRNHVVQLLRAVSSLRDGVLSPLHLPNQEHFLVPPDDVVLQLILSFIFAEHFK